jgi:two-component system, NarL family, sensor kinase
MRLILKTRLIFSSFILLTWVVVGCSNQKKSNLEAYIKPPEEKLDSVDTYLIERQNLGNKNYAETYTLRFKKYLRVKKIDSAARVLTLVGKAYYDNFGVNQVLANQQLSFINTYENQISPRYIAELYFYVGSQYFEKNSLDSSIYYLKKCLIKPTDYYTMYYNGMGCYMLSLAYMYVGKSDKSLEAGMKSQRAFETVGDLAKQSDVVDAMGSLFRIARDYPEALKLSTKAYKLAKLSKDTSSILSAAINRISLYNEMNHPNLFQFTDSVLVFANQWKHQTEDDEVMLQSYKSSQLTRQKKLKEARQILDKYSISYQKTTNINAKELYELALAEYDLAKGMGSSNIKHYEKLIAEIKEENDFVRLGIYYQILRDDAVLKQNYKKAFDYQTLVEATDDSLSNMAMKAKVKELDKKYQTVKKQQLINSQNAQLKQNKTLIYALTTSIVGLFLLIFTFYLWQKQKTLKQQKENSMNFTKQLLESTEDERKRIASDLHDSVSHELLSLKTMLRGDFSELNSKVDAIINDIRGISRNLHPVMFDKIGLQANIEQLVERVAIQHDFLVSTEIDYKSSLSTSTELQIYRIIQESLTNIIKYANAHAAKISIEELPDKVCVEIKDNGKGFNVKEMLNSQKAFGLHNIIERSRVIGGEAKIKSSEEGTVITITVPKLV